MSRQKVLYPTKWENKRDYILQLLSDGFYFGGI